MTSDIVPFGLYKGQSWSSVPESYLFYMGNNARGSARDMCRAEVMKRYARRGKPDPWEKKP